MLCSMYSGNDMQASHDYVHRYYSIVVHVLFYMCTQCSSGNVVVYDGISDINSQTSGDLECVVILHGQLVGGGVGAPKQCFNFLW